MINYLYTINDNKEPFGKFANEWFAQRSFHCRTPPQFKNNVLENEIIKIKYIENCRLWQPKWARHCRGVVLMQMPNKKFVCIKSLLPRGSEILTGIHLKAGIDETQDFKNKFYDHLDDVQKDTIVRLSKNEPIKGYLSFKCDGSLLGISLYKVGTEIYNIVSNIIDSFGDDFSKEVKRLSQKLGFLPVFHSQDTYFLSNMQGYTLTSIACGFCKMQFNDLKHLSSTNTPASLVYVIEPFLKSLQTFYNALPESLSADAMSLSYETICENRTSAWGECHTELAIQYDKSMIRFLGLATHLETTPVYHPHLQLEETIKETGWEQPLWWSVNHANEIDKFISDLELIIVGKKTEADYLLEHPVCNTLPLQNLNFDYEGFVFYRAIDETADPKLCILDYSKIKTNIYYKAHKFKHNNIPELMSLSPSVDDIFPMVRTVKIFFGGLKDKLNNALIQVVCDSQQWRLLNFV